MKKTKKTLKEKFNKVIHSEGFKKFKKILDWIVYLYALILTIVLIVGISMPKQNNVQSNKNRKSSNVSEVMADFFDTSYDYYELSEELSFSRYASRLYQPFWLPYIDFTTPVASDYSDYTLDGDWEGFYLYGENGEEVAVNGLYCLLKSARIQNQHQNTNYYPVIEELGFFIETPEIETNLPLLVFEASSTPTLPANWHLNLLHSYDNDDLGFVVDYNILIDKLNIFDNLRYIHLKYIYHLFNYSYSYYFASQINYNFPKNEDYGLPFYEGTAGRVNYYFDFVSNGQVFKGMSFEYLNPSSADNTNIFIINGGSGHVSISNANYIYFSSLSYINLDDSYTIANRRSSDAFFDEDGSVLIGIGDRSSWLNGAYRTIEILTNDDTLVDLFDGLNTFNGVTFEGYSSYQFGDVFSLLSRGFSAMLTIFAINIIPGVSIGLLLYLPLVVTILMLTVRLVKK